MALANHGVRVRSWSIPGFLLAALAGCAGHSPSPVPLEGAGDGPRSGDGAMAENPFGGGRPTHAERIAAYFAERGLAFRASAESPWVALDGTPALRIEVSNGGALPVTIVLSRDLGVWPFTREERGCLVVESTATWASWRHGVQVAIETVRVDQAADVVVPVGGSASLRIELPLALPAGAEAVVARVAPQLHPLAIRCGDEPERVISIELPPIELRFGPAAVAHAAAGDEVPFERALAELPEHLIAAALHHGEAAKVPTIDRLIVSLPGPDRRGRRARCVALEWLTGQRHGESVERWRGWWEAQGAPAPAAAATGGERER
ncbi:MAG: hypothetical protein FJ293_14160 [Planctomycetes bacterium]|nr:hypothetical protein [Planctomycetota bacterium]